VEETYELIDAIETGQDTDLQEELGDVLLQVVFHAQVANDRRAFGIDDVARGIVDKLVRRHPHVFADGDARTPEEVQTNWDRLKTAEKARQGPFEGVPALLPGLHLLDTLQRKASKRGFDAADTADASEQVHARLAGLAAAASAEHREAAYGELLAAVVSLGRQLGVDPETAARGAGRRFRARFEAVVRLAAERELDPDELDRDGWWGLWTEVGSDA
jgi:MazG family protein